MRRPISPQIALERLAGVCARQEVSEYDAREKLRRWGIASADATRILERLIDESFISDERFARAFVRDKYRFAGWGRRKIAIGLAAKRIERSIIAEALDEAVDEDEYRSRLEALLRAKARSLPPELHSTFEGRQKLYIFAAARGFESSLISSVINSSSISLWPSDLET